MLLMMYQNTRQQAFTIEYCLLKTILSDQVSPPAVEF